MFVRTCVCTQVGKWLLKSKFKLIKGKINIHDKLTTCMGSWYVAMAGAFVFLTSEGEGMFAVMLSHWWRYQEHAWTDTYFPNVSVIPVSRCSSKRNGVNPGEEAGPVLLRGWQPSHACNVLSWDTLSSSGTAIVSGSWPQLHHCWGKSTGYSLNFRYLWFSFFSLCVFMRHWVLVTHQKFPFQHPIMVIEKPLCLSFPLSPVQQRLAG